MGIGVCQRAIGATLGGACAIAFAGLLAVPLPAHAQTTPEAAPPVAVDPFAPGVVTDFRENMRTFVQSISAYGRSINPRFVVIAKGGLDLVGKPDPEDDTRIFPARTYMRAIDGVMETGLLDETITTPDGKFDPTLEEVVKRRNANLAIARTFGLSVFDLEFATDAKTIDAHYGGAAKKGVVSLVAEAPALATIPAHPKSIHAANPKPIAAAAEAQNFLYIANSSHFGDTNDFTQALRNTNFDAVVIDVFHGHKPLTRQDVSWMKYKKLGAPRLVLAEIDIAAAATFHYYWQPDWAPGNPPFMGTPMRQDPDRFRTFYWDAGWQSIITGDFNSYVYGVIDLGFDGVVLKGVDGWRYFETGGEE